MSFCIQDPSYEHSKYLHEILLSTCENSISGGGTYAFATKDGVELFLADESFKQFIKKGMFFLVIGMDDITNVRTLDSLKSLKNKYGKNLIVKAYIHNNKGSTFHPKFSWFKNDNGGVLVLGSGNLTQKGLRHNREAFNVIEHNDVEMQSVIDEWNKWITHSTPFLFDLENPLVLERAQQNTIKTFITSKAKMSASETQNSDVKTALEELYKSQPKDKSLKKGQTKKDIKSDNATNTMQAHLNVFTDEDADADESYWKISLSCETLVAEIPKSGDRWKQANFDKDSFEHYFGATCGENGAYRILLKSIKQDNSLGETEIRPSVSVASQNYRFELDAANGLNYPKGGLRPIAIFFKVSCRDFLYELVMPDNDAYNEVVKLLDSTQVSSTKMRRIKYNCQEVYRHVPSLAIWTRLEE
ncbi:MAG: hypothetical protein GXZ14_01800 [Ruminococcaceae bacterium]|nr:hypothetical protein [Oscillospiraceae bacterium]